GWWTAGSPVRPRGGQPLRGAERRLQRGCPPELDAAVAGGSGGSDRRLPEAVGGHDLAGRAVRGPGRDRRLRDLLGEPAQVRGSAVVVPGRRRGRDWNEG